METSRAPEMMLIVDKWQQLKFVSPADFAKYVPTSSVHRSISIHLHISDDLLTTISPLSNASKSGLYKTRSALPV